VGEVVAIPEFAHDPAPPQFVDRPHHDVGVQVAGLSEQVKAEVPAHRGGQASHLAGGRGGLLEPVVQHCAEIARRTGCVPAVRGAARRLNHVQREASRGRLEQQRV
jgi:hypothetical protein